MGIYCNPVSLNTPYKQDFFRLASENGQIIKVRGITDMKDYLEKFDVTRTEKHYGVCVVSNGPFDAAGIAHPRDQELAEWNVPDQRPKSFYVCSRSWLVEQDPLLEELLP
jgi:hypothetical protein